MATTKYYYRPHESLSLIAKRYNTDIKTLTTLNSWLINPHTKKVELFPAKIKYLYKQNNSIAKQIRTEKPIKPGTLKVTVYERADFSGQNSLWADDKYGNVKTLAGSGDTKYIVKYSNRTLDAKDYLTLQTVWKSMTVEYEADIAKNFLVVPLIGNGNTSIEDYWENVDKVTGISLNKMITSLATDESTLLTSPALTIRTDNSHITEATMDAVRDSLNPDMYDSESSGTTSGGFNSSSELNDYSQDMYGSRDVSYRQGNLYQTDGSGADFNAAHIGVLYQTALNEGSSNMRDYFTGNLYRTEQRDIIGENNHTAALYATTYNGTRAFTTFTPSLDNYNADNSIHRVGSIGETGIYTNVATTRGQKSAWSRDKELLYSYNTIGVQRDDSINEMVHVIVGNTIIYMPCWPENVQDGASAEYDLVNVVGRSAPYVIYSRTSERTIDFTFKLHREMLDCPISVSNGTTRKTSLAISNDAEIDKIIRIIESAVYPNYDGTVSAIKTQVKVGNNLYISGVMTKQSSNWYGPIGDDGKYKQCDISFTILEVTDSPKSHTNIKQMGGWRTS